MNCISWNCRGLGQPHVVLELTELVKKVALNHHPHGDQIKRAIFEETLFKA